MGATGVLTAIQTGVGLWSSFQQASAIKEQGKAEEKLADQNVKVLNLQADDAISRGNIQAAEIKRKAQYVKGSQAAAFAGQGVSATTGTPASILSETDAASGLDVITAKNNAFREAWGYKTDAINEQFKGQMKRIAAKNEARNTLLTGGLTAVDDITKGIYLNNRFKNTGVTPAVEDPSTQKPIFVPRNPTEARFNRDYTNRYSRPRR